MCREIKCQGCGKSTYAGCGMHVDDVKASVAKAGREWCTCSTSSSKGSSCTLSSSGK